MASKYTTQILARDAWPEWNDFVDNTPQGTVFHRSEWLLALVDNPEDLSYLVCRNASGALAGGLPLVRLPILWYNAYRLPRFAPFAGLVLSEPTPAKLPHQYSEQKEKALALLGAMPKAALIRFPLHVTNPDAQPFVWHGFSVGVGYTYRIENSCSLDQVWDGMDPKQRNIVRKAQKEGVVVRTTTHIEEFLPQIHMTFARQHLPAPLSDKTCGRLWHAASAMQRRSIYMAYDMDGTPEGGLMVVWDPRSTYLLLAGGDPQRRSSGGATLALWQAIQDALARGQAFDFEGSTLPGVERHYRSWGGRLRTLFQVEKVRPWFLQLALATQAWKMHRQMAAAFRATTAQAKSSPDT